MTRYAWDVSDYDWPRGPMDVAKAHAEGIDLLTHKISEGTGYTSAHAGEALKRGLAAGIPVLGGYHVLLPGDMANIDAQVQHYLASLDFLFPKWRKHPCFIHQIDAEKFDYMTRKPTLAEIHQFGHGVIEQAKCQPSQVIAYAPHWLYGENLRGLKFHLWASSYVGGTGGFKNLYPGDGASQWSAYSGITPAALQFTSTATIAGQHPADANAIRVSTVDELVALFVPKHDQTQEDIVMDKETKQYFDQQFADLEKAVVTAVVNRIDNALEDYDGTPSRLRTYLRRVTPKGYVEPTDRPKKNNQ